VGLVKKVDEFALRDAVEQATLVQSGEVAGSELLDDALARIEKYDPVINAVVSRRGDGTKDSFVQGPVGSFSNVPLLLKDLGNPSAGDPYYEGSRLLRDLNWRAKHDGVITTKLKDAGFVICGRTNTAEWGSLPTTEPVAFGPTRNPWDLRLSAGGSSGGSAAAVAAGMVAVATGSDGGGSIRIPAAVCGLVGLKPTSGRISLGPDAGEGWGGLLVPGVLTRTVRDTCSVLSLMAGSVPGDPHVAPGRIMFSQNAASKPPNSLRIGVLTEIPGSDVYVARACVEAVDATSAILSELGHQVEDAFPSPLRETADVRRHYGRIFSSWLGFSLESWTQRTGRMIGADDLEPHNLEIAERGRRRSAASYIASREWLHSWNRRMAGWWYAGFDLLLTPTLPEPPFELGEMKSDSEDPLRVLDRAGDLAAFTLPYNVTGQPAVSLPLQWTPDGLPLGIQLVARFGMEDQLIGVAYQLEQACPWESQYRTLVSSLADRCL
jgi:amidase